MFIPRDLEHPFHTITFPQPRLRANLSLHWPLLLSLDFSDILGVATKGMFPIKAKNILQNFSARPNKRLYSKNSANHTDREESLFHYRRPGSCCVVALFYVHGKHLRSCRDGQLT